MSLETMCVEEVCTAPFLALPGPLPLRQNEVLPGPSSYMLLHPCFSSAHLILIVILFSVHNNL